MADLMLLQSLELDWLSEPEPLDSKKFGEIIQKIEQSFNEFTERSREDKETGIYPDEEIITLSRLFKEYLTEKNCQDAGFEMIKFFENFSSIVFPNLYLFSLCLDSILQDAFEIIKQRQETILKFTSLAKFINVVSFLKEDITDTYINSKTEIDAETLGQVQSIQTILEKYTCTFDSFESER